jgi:hypothetical protein
MKPKDEIDECSRLLDCLSRHVEQVIPMWDGRREDAKLQLDSMSLRADQISRKLLRLAKLNHP